MSNLKVGVLIATYNGELFLREQLDSIVNNDAYHIIERVVISDDGSNDSTTSLVAGYGEKFELIFNDSGSNGPAANFFNGLNHCRDFDLLFLCDQDDIWEKSKIFDYLSAAKELDPLIPGLLYSDVNLVDYKGTSLGKTFLENESIPSNWGMSVGNLVFQNCAPGCSMMLNRMAVERVAGNYKSEIVMHDWWVLLFSSLYKNVFYIEKSTMGYRQHANNAVGATKKASLRTIIQKAVKSKTNFDKVINQICYFEDSLSANEIVLLNDQDREFIRKVKEFKLHGGLLCRFRMFFLFRRYKSTMIREAVTRLYFLF